MTDNKKISLKEVEHIADLARIELSSGEIKKFANELSGVLGYIEKLGEVNTNNIEPVSQVTGLVNVLRDDIIEDSSEETREKIINNFPEERDGYIKVKQIM